MNFVYIGDIVNTHGIKGEIRIRSFFQKKDAIFKSNFFLYLGNEKKKVKIVQYRHHKDFEMVFLEGYTNINDVLAFKGTQVFINREDLKMQSQEYLYDDLLGFTVIEDNLEYGVVQLVINDTHNPLLYVVGEKKFYIPLLGNYIKNVDLNCKKIYTTNGKSLIL